MNKASLRRNRNSTLLRGIALSFLILWTHLGTLHGHNFLRYFWKVNVGSKIDGFFSPATNHLKTSKYGSFQYWHSITAKNVYAEENSLLDGLITSFYHLFAECGWVLIYLVSWFTQLESLTIILKWRRTRLERNKGGAASDSIHSNALVISCLLEVEYRQVFPVYFFSSIEILVHWENKAHLCRSTFSDYTAAVSTSFWDKTYWTWPHHFTWITQRHAKNSWIAVAEQKHMQKVRRRTSAGSLLSSHVRRFQFFYIQLIWCTNHINELQTSTCHSSISKTFRWIFGDSNNKISEDAGIE